MFGRRCSCYPGGACDNGVHGAPERARVDAMRRRVPQAQPDVQAYGILLDGFPRNKEQADLLEANGTEVDLFLLLKVLSAASPFRRASSRTLARPLLPPSKFESSSLRSSSPFLSIRTLSARACLQLDIAPPALCSCFTNAPAQ